MSNPVNLMVHIVYGYDASLLSIPLPASPIVIRKTET